MCKENCEKYFGPTLKLLWQNYDVKISWFTVFFFRYKITPAKDAENGALQEFDPFKERHVEHPTT